MAGLFTHVLINTIISFLFALSIVLINTFIGIPTESLNFINQYFLTLQNLVLFLLGGAIFDIDHLFYYGLTTPRPKIKNMIKRMQDDFVAENPHPYVFHSVEFVVIFALILGLILPLMTFLNATETFYNFLIILFGWIIHLCVDISFYIKHYKSHKPWLGYFSMINLLISYLKKKSGSLPSS